MLAETVRAEDYDPFSPAVMNNPLPYYKALRRDRPVFYSEKYDGFFFSRFEDMVELLSHGDNSLLQSEGSLPLPAVLAIHSAEPPPPPAPGAMPISQKLGMPLHGEVRRAHIKPMMPRGLNVMKAFVQELADARLDALLPRRSFNLTREYGGIVSSSVVLKLMGMPLDLAGQALDIINSGTRTDPEFGGFDSGAVARQAIAFYMPYVRARAEAGPDGSVPMVDGMLKYRFEGREISAGEAGQQLVCAFIGGIETVPKITAHGLLELSRRPDQLSAVRADLEANVPKVVEEMIRYCAPAQWFMRTVHKPITIAGQALKPGQRVFFMAGSASRDEREFDDPDAFRWDRNIRRTLAFGQGVHFCIGAHLARMEIAVMVEAFLRRVEEFSFDMDAAVRHPSSFQWGWNDLPVRVA